MTSSTSGKKENVCHFQGVFPCRVVSRRAFVPLWKAQSAAFICFKWRKVCFGIAPSFSLLLSLPLFLLLFSKLCLGIPDVHSVISSLKLGSPHLTAEPFWTFYCLFACRTCRFQYVPHHTPECVWINFSGLIQYEIRWFDSRKTASIWPQLIWYDLKNKKWYFQLISFFFRNVLTFVQQKLSQKK